MEPTERERLDLGERISRKRLELFEGNRKAAYTAAKVNSGTWTRAEAGETLTEVSRVRIIKTLWPETGGDWRLLDPPLGGEVDLEEEVRRAVDLSAGAKERLLEMLANEPPSPKRGAS